MMLRREIELGTEIMVLLLSTPGIILGSFLGDWIYEAVRRKAWGL